MHIWGYIAIHPMTFPLAGEVAHTAIMMGKLVTSVYGAVLQPTVEEIIIVIQLS